MTDGSNMWEFFIKKYIYKKYNEGKQVVIVYWQSMPKQLKQTNQARADQQTTREYSRLFSLAPGR